jgi:flagellar M-ring protein FliF
VSDFADTLLNIGAPRLAIMGTVLVGIFLFFIFISLRATTPEMKLLYSDLSTVDSSAIAAKLESSDIKYDISVDGARILVSEKEVGKARLLLAESGLPNGGSLGYEIFDEQSGFGTTNFVQNINQVRALEGELARTISAMGAVRSARVHLVLPQRELFSRESRPSSASVYLGIRPGNIVEREQIRSIQSLVASAVPDLKIAQVTIIDSNGKLLARGGEENAEGQMSAKAEERRRSYESRLTNKIEDQVSRIVGYGKVRAIVTAEMNFDRISTNEELFDPSSQVVRSSQVTEESGTERDPPSDEVTVGNNLPGIGGGLLDGNAPTAESNRLEEITNFEISKTIRSTVREVGEVNKLSVAVLLDGKYVPNPEAADNPDAPKRIYEERSEEELEQIAELVRSAVGYNENRGDIITVKNLQFAEIDTNEDALDDSLLMGFPKSDLIDAAEFLLVGVMIILVVLLVLQPMVARLLATDSVDTSSDTMEMDLLAAGPANPALAPPSGAPGEEGVIPDDDSLIDMAGVTGQVKSSSVKKVEEIVESYPAETVSVIRSWMTQES